MKLLNQCFPLLGLLFGAFFGCVSPAISAAGLLGDSGGVNNHPHNLSSNSTAAIKSSTEDRICIFCHAPHGTSAQGALWNRPDPVGPVGGFPLYANVEQGLKDSVAADYDDSDQTTYPNGSTRLCLSCHDGVTAIAEVVSGGDLDLGLGNMTTEGSSMVVDLSQAHPVSFVFNQTIATDVYGARFDLSAMLPGVLDSAGRLQCGGCHDPHTDTFVGNGVGEYDLPMWRYYASNGADADDDYNKTCESCHKAAPLGLTHDLPHN